ncbi:37S ribosomal protein S10, mitochondrial [Smittium culicis]|uniref:Small ribosomal subunit protein uS10m n=1 Tax=Smittium culicis TaxID=133412 RepID=A0A1R1YAU7_9FUNG|nr:37S ribosomal protein S10, mitochondrial [Smittium culicis]
MLKSSSIHTPLLTKALGEKLFIEEETVPIESIDEVYGAPKRLESIHGVTVCQLQLRSYSLHRLDFYVEFIQRAAYAMNIPCSGNIPLPVHKKRWVVLKSPFVHKSAMEVFERRTHKRLVQIRDTNIETLEKWIKYVEDNVPGGIGLKCKVFEYEKVGFGATMKIDQIEAKKAQETAASLPANKEDIKKIADIVVEALSKNPKANIQELTKDAINSIIPKNKALEK